MNLTVMRRRRAKLASLTSLAYLPIFARELPIGHHPSIRTTSIAQAQGGEAPPPLLIIRGAFGRVYLVWGAYLALHT